MTVTIEEIRKPYDDVHFYCVKDENLNMRMFSYKDHMPMDDIYNKEEALKRAKAFAMILKAGVTETRTLIETL